ncbi:MAG TPA: CRISPR-associated endoribonuclease Cas6 [bacterium]|jgi:CRISPR-associated endoribonuclease Cas6|nr:CRISPR-associated endoribonuclease Cas6 [bacterium]HOX86229.1 CRISPR-associated endoribonuclease Cas6 [bacterium]HPG45557.1 CRISPR-associated endoribonuclease Cas6 [bacterium]HPM97664.1 CRISPR-associated endoribonuclease Cas6 [bacterium]
MRIRLACTASHYTSLAYNTNHEIAAWIYRQLESASPEFAAFLHDRGYTGPDGKARKLFTFSRLMFTPKPQLKKTHIMVKRDSRIELVIATPLFEEFVQHLVMGLFENHSLCLTDIHNRMVEFPISLVTRVPEPHFTSRMHFRTLSPLVLKTAVDQDDGLGTYYYRVLDAGLSESIRKSLRNKFTTIHQRAPADDSLEFRPDSNYIDHKGGPEKVSTLITIRQVQGQPINVKGFTCPFDLSGSTELIETAWHAGIGDYTAMGFGCVEEINP